MDINFKKIFQRQAGAKQRSHTMNTFRDWKVLVICTMILNFAAVGISLYVFWAVHSGSLYEVDAGEVKPQVEKLNEAGLEKIVKKFEATSAGGIEFSTSTIVVDPSL